MSDGPSLNAMLSALIGTPSISSVNPEFDHSNRAVIDHLAQWLEELKFTVDIQPLDTQLDKANLIASLGEGDGGLVLAGHTDTVPYDFDDWQSDPFKLIEKHNRLYGLGTADMKSFLALAIEASRQYSAKQLKEPLIIVATADEESSMDGANALVKLGRPKARYAVVGEPTGLTPIRAHKGMMMEAIRVSGQAGHSSDPALGNSALEGMHLVIKALLAFRSELEQKYHDELFTYPAPTLNLGHIHGGDNPNRICSHCELQFDLRPLPGMEPEELRHNIVDKLQQISHQTGLSIQLESLVQGTPPITTPAESPIVKMAEELSGLQAQAASYCTEAPYFTQLGMQTIVMGPGNIAQAHQPDEYLDLEYIPKTINVLRNMIKTCCVTPTAT